MYLKKSKMASSKAVSVVQMIVGMIGAVFFGFGVVAGLTGDPSLKDDLGIAIFLMLPFLWLVWLSVRKGQLRGAANRYNNLFERDQDGYIGLAEIADKVGRSQEQVTKDIRQLLRRGYLVNCTMEEGRRAQVVLRGEFQRPEEQYVPVECPHCGATSMVRKGFLARCEYCGSEIKPE